MAAIPPGLCAEQAHFRLKILHTIHSVDPAGGGPIEGLKQLAAVHRAQGHEVEVASLDAPEAPWVRACPLPCHALGPGRFGYGYAPRFSPWLRAARSGYDAVVVNGLWQYAAFGTWRALRGSGTPYAVYPHGMLDPWFRRTYPLKHLKKWLYWPWADYRVLRDAAAVLFTSEEERRLARQSFWLYRCRERVVGYGTPGPSGDPAEQRRAFLSKFPELAGRRCLLFFGRIHVKKGPDLLLRAWAETVRSAPPECHLVMAGPGEPAYLASLAALAERLGLAGRITWTGLLTGNLKWGALRSADAFILPSHQENFGVAVAEALACGLPVLISNQVNIWPEVAADGAGLVEADTASGARLLIERWLSLSAEERTAMGGRAAGCFERRFRIELAAERLLQALQETKKGP